MQSEHSSCSPVSPRTFQALTSNAHGIEISLVVILVDSLPHPYHPGQPPLMTLETGSRKIYWSQCKHPSSKAPENTSKIFKLHSVVMHILLKLLSVSLKL